MDVVLFVGVIGGCWVLWISAIVSVVRSADPDWERIGRSRTASGWLVVLTGVLGATYYWLRIRPELDAAP